MTNFDPATYQLRADLSRADVRVLYEHCNGRRVVEFGCGGSTLMLEEFVSELDSYDTDSDWIARVRRRLASESKVRLHWCSDPPLPALPQADVYFIDGHVPHRAVWVRAVIERRLSELILVHDSRSSAMSDIATMLTWPRVLSLRSLEYHVNGSNMLVLRCGAPCEYVNWNETEPENRLPFLD